MEFKYNQINEGISRACALAAHSVFHPSPRWITTFSKQSAITSQLQNQFMDVEDETRFDADGWIESISNKGECMLDAIKHSDAGEMARTFETICYATVRPFITNAPEGPLNFNNEAQYLLNKKMVCDLPNGRRSMIHSRAVRVSYDFTVPIFYYDPYASQYSDKYNCWNDVELLPWQIGNGSGVDAMRSGLQIIQHVDLGCLISEVKLGCFGYMDCPPVESIGQFHSPFDGTIWYLYRDFNNEDTQAWVDDVRKSDTIQ